MIRPHPKSLQELETRFAEQQRIIQEWQSKASSLMTELGVEIPEECSPDEFFQALVQYRVDERWNHYRE